jgi:hypothetical protein
MLLRLNLGQGSPWEIVAATFGMSAEKAPAAIAVPAIARTPLFTRVELSRGRSPGGTVMFRDAMYSLSASRSFKA